MKNLFFKNRLSNPHFIYLESGPSEAPESAEDEVATAENQYLLTDRELQKAFNKAIPPQTYSVMLGKPQPDAQASGGKDDKKKRRVTYHTPR